MTSRSQQKAREADPRYQRSYQALIGAILALVDQEPVGQISIIRVVEAAGVTRPTFYQHFPDVAAAAQAAALRRLDAAFVPLDARDAEASSTVAALRQRIEDRARPALQHLAAHRTFYLRVIEGAATAAFFGEVVRLVAAHLLPDTSELIARRGNASRQDLTDMLAGGTMWLVVRWLRGELDEDADGLAQRLAGISVALVQPDLPAGGQGSGS